MNETRRTVTVNGISLSVKESGTGRDVILVHGKGLSKESMDRLFVRLCRRFHTVSYDVRGHGESDKPPAFTLEDHADDLRGLTEALELRQPVAVGFSMGSYIALRAAEKYPGLFSGLILIGTKGGGATSSVQRLQQEAAALGMDREETARYLRRHTYAPRVTPQEIDGFLREIAGPVALTREQRAAITASLHHMELLGDAHRVTVPVLVLTGEYDGLNPPDEGRRVAEALPEGQFAVIPRAGHFAFFENPEAVISQIEGFLE